LPVLRHQSSVTAVPEMSRFSATAGRSLTWHNDCAVQSGRHLCVLEAKSYPVLCMYLLSGKKTAHLFPFEQSRASGASGAKSTVRMSARRRTSRYFYSDDELLASSPPGECTDGGLRPRQKVNCWLINKVWVGHHRVCYRGEV